MDLSQPLHEFKKLIIDRNAKITIVGLGKMGLPLCAVFTNQGFTVIGLDNSNKVVENLKSKKFMIDEPLVADRLSVAIDTQKFIATTDKNEAFLDSDFIIIIIPVLTDDDGFADISGLRTLYQEISSIAKNSPIIIQESTLPPGTTSGPLKEILSQNGRISGEHFGLAFAPERTFSGRAIADIEERYPKIIGADTNNVADIAKILYEQVCQKGVIIVSNPSTAEAVKTFKGAYRDANIAIANELAILADQFGVDIIEIIEAANTEPFSHLHMPGLGVGGHCIPVYPRFLIAQSQKSNHPAQIFPKSRELNDFMVNYCIELLEKEIDLNDKNILVLGLAYRSGVKEIRNTPTLRLVPELRVKGANVVISDPLFEKDEIDKIFGIGSNWDFEINKLTQFDIVIIATDHNLYKNLEPKLENLLVYDGRYVLDPTKGKIIQPGRLHYFKR